MKHSQDYYKNLKRLEELKYDNIKYHVEIKKAWTWFHIVNEQIFDNLLEPVDKMFISTHKKYGDVYALYHYDEKKRKQPSKISFIKTFKSEKMFVEILAHEMIHHFQYTYDEPLGHGPTFLAWRENFNLKGLKLYKAK